LGAQVTGKALRRIMKRVLIGAVLLVAAYGMVYVLVDTVSQPAPEISGRPR
jgi:hypothetical protein